MLKSAFRTALLNDRDAAVNDRYVNPKDANVIGILLKFFRFSISVAMTDTELPRIKKAQLTSNLSRRVYT